MSGYVTSDPDQQHVIYMTGDGHVHELAYDNGWSHNDLTNLAQAPSAAAGSSLSGYVTSDPYQQHVIYMTSDGHMHELAYDNGWSHNDLTNLAQAPPATTGSFLSACVTVDPAQQHVIYVADLHVHELVYDQRWHHNVITALANGPVPLPAPLVAFSSVDPNQLHVNHLTGDGHVQELVYDHGWHHNDLTGRSDSPDAAQPGALAGYDRRPAGAQSVCTLFAGVDRALHAIDCSNGWQRVDFPGAPEVEALEGLIAYLTSDPSQEHVIYISVDGHVHELFW